jgi:hypothetical protein
MSKCYGCGKEFPGRMREVSFDFQGALVKDHVPGLKCDECFKKEFVRRFETYASEIIKIENGHVSVDWEKFLDLGRKRIRRDVIMQLLEGFGILSIYQLGGWRIDVGHGSANPRMLSTGTKMLFTRRNDARDYASLACQGSAGFEIYRQSRLCH